jgi:hypothetical protein
VRRTTYEIGGVPFIDCLDSDFYDEGEMITGGVAWSPTGGNVILWIQRGTTAITFGPWTQCNDTSMECRDVDGLQTWSQTDFYEVDPDLGTSTLLFSVPDAVESAAVSEDGREIMVRRKTWQATNTVRWVLQAGANPIRQDEWHEAYQNCVVEWRDPSSGAVVATSPFSRICYTFDITPATGFEETWNWYMGTMAP